MGSTNPRSGKIIAERLNKFFDDMAKKKEEIRRKTDMKEKTMRRQLAKLRQQFNQREEMGESTCFELLLLNCEVLWERWTGRN